MTADLRKIPVPMTVPTTIEIAPVGFSSRLSGSPPLDIRAAFLRTERPTLCFFSDSSRRMGSVFLDAFFSNFTRSQLYEDDAQDALLHGCRDGSRADLWFSNRDCRANVAKLAHRRPFQPHIVGRV